MEIKHRTQLPDLLKHLGLPLIAVELGCAEGLSAKDFLEAGIEEIYLVDTWATIQGQSGDGGHPQEWHDKNYNDLRDRLRKYGEKVQFRRGKTADAAEFIPDNIAGLVYVDADHSLDGVTQDIHNYWPKLVSGGVMAFHDYEMDEIYGVKQAVQQFAKENDLVVHLISEHKREDAGAWIRKP